MSQKSGLSREVTSQRGKFTLYLVDQHVPNLLACHERVVAHERGLSKEVLPYTQTYKGFLLSSLKKYIIKTEITVRCKIWTNESDNIVPVLFPIVKYVF